MSLSPLDRPDAPQGLLAMSKPVRDDVDEAFGSRASTPERGNHGGTINVNR